MSDKKAEILRCGKELFSAKGFKDTNVAEITKMAGMATGTFYIYYPSKEKLFMDLYMEENVKLKKSILERIDLDADPLSLVKQTLYLNVEGIQSNPILKEWYNKDVYGKLEQHFRTENGLERVDFLYNFFLDMVKKWQAEGKMRSDIDAEMIMAIFDCIINVDTHKEEVGIQYFPDVLDYLAEFTLRGLMDTSGNSAKAVSGVHA